MASTPDRAAEFVAEAEESRRQVEAEKGVELTDQYLVGWLASRAANLEKSLMAARAYARGLQDEVGK